MIISHRIQFSEIQFDRPPERNVSISHLLYLRADHVDVVAIKYTHLGDSFLFWIPKPSRSARRRQAQKALMCYGRSDGTTQSSSLITPHRNAMTTAPVTVFFP